MKERPIIFTENIPAILEGRKTQTRRVIKLKGYSREIWDKCVPHNGDKAILLGEPYLKVPYDPITDNAGNRITCPYGQVGDRLWVRESYGYLIDGSIAYRADCDPWHLKHGYTIKWKPSIHMFRKDSRITLEITEVRVERLQEVTPEDCIEEGIISGISLDTGLMEEEAIYEVDLIIRFERRWDSLNAKRGYGWEVNLWVWVISFKRVGV